MKELKEQPNCWAVIAVTPPRTEGKHNTKLAIDPKQIYKHELRSPLGSNWSNGWTSYQEAVQALDYANKHLHDGHWNTPVIKFTLALKITPPLIFIDVDDIDEDPEVSADFKELTKLTGGTYCEVSQSGKGLHFLARGQIEEGHKNRNGKFEIYTNDRYCAFTGQQISRSNQLAELDQDAIHKVLEYGHVLKKAQKKPARFVGVADNTKSLQISIPQVVEKMLSNSKNGQRDRLFLQGGWEEKYESQSEADLAFCNDLAFWTGKDPKMMDEIFRRSSLMRPKWDELHGENTYGAITMAKAIEDTNKVYQPQPSKPFIDNQFKFNNPTQKMTVVDTDHKPEEALKPGLWTENYISDYLVERHGDDLKHTTDPDKWYVYSAKTGTWEADKTASVGRQARETIDWLSQQKPVAPADTDPADYVGQWQSFIKKAGNASAKARIIKEAGEYEGVAITQDDFNRQPMLLNTPGKAVNLATGKEVQGRKKLLFDQHTTVTPAKGKGAKRWRRFLKQIFLGNLELILWFQKVLGYAITGATGEQVFFIMLGEGQNGKSVLAKVIEGILGNYAHSANINTFLDTGTQSGSAPTPDIVAMDGKRFVFTAEPKKYAKLDTNKIRLFTGEDTLVGRDLHEKGQREFESHFKLFISANHMLKLDMDDYSIARRVVVIPFKFRVKDDEVDKDLAKELLEEEGPEILDWLLEGAKRWKEEGLKTHWNPETSSLASGYPDEVSNAIIEYKTATDNVLRWVDDDCSVDDKDNKDDEEHWESNKALYADYRQWCINNGEEPEKESAWGKHMAKYFERKRKKVGRGWIGIRISEGADKHNGNYNFGNLD